MVYAFQTAKRLRKILKTAFIIRNPAPRDCCHSRSCVPERQLYRSSKRHLHEFELVVVVCGTRFLDKLSEIRFVQGHLLTMLNPIQLRTAVALEGRLPGLQIKGRKLQSRSNRARKRDLSQGERSVRDKIASVRVLRSILRATHAASSKRASAEP